MNIKDFIPVIWGNCFTQERPLSISDFELNFSVDIINTKRKEYYAKPIDDILLLLERVGKRFLDTGSSCYQEVLTKLPGIIDYSDNMVKAGLAIIPKMLSRESLEGRLHALGNYHSLDYFAYEGKSRIKRFMPVGLISHIAAGNIFLGSIDSLIYGMITKNLNILKVSRQDFLFPTIFFKILKEEDRDNLLTPYINMVYWSRNDREIDSFIKAVSDAILLFGGEEAVMSYKNGLSAKTEIWPFGPKISFGILCRDLGEKELKDCAEGFARDIVYWEQRACTSCQNIFVEDSGNVQLFLNLLYEALEKMGREFPQNRIPLDSAVEIKKEREIANYGAFCGNSAVYAGKSSCHTIISKKQNDLVDSPLNRTIYVNIVNNYRDILKGNVRYMKYYLSTVSIGCRNGLQQVLDDFTGLGVLRFCRPGSMSTHHDPLSAHDGVHIAKLLVKEVAYEDLPVLNLGISYLSKKEKEGIILSRLNSLLQESLKSPFYSKFYKDMELPLKSLDDFKAIPILEKSHLAENSADRNFNLLTAKPDKCYIFSAGGTTGSMKYVCYSYEEFEESEKVFGYGFRSAGINSDDVVANLLKSGAFWTGFLAVNKGLEETGCRILSITGNHSEQQIMDYLRLFKANTIIGVPSLLLFLAQYAQSKNIELKLDKIYYAGEILTQSNQDYLTKVFSAGKIASFGYAAVEIGPIGYQCAYCTGTQHHVFDDYCYLEDVDQGDAIVTCLSRRLNPIIRYRICDRIEWSREQCRCGRSTPKFSLMGRTGDMIKLNYCNLYLSEVESAINKFPELSPFYQIKIENEGNDKKLTFSIELKSSDSILENSPDFAEKILKEIQNSSKSLSSDLKERQISRLLIRILSPGKLERIERTGKIKKIIDERND